MALETGTATNHVDLLNKLVTFLTSTLTPSGERWVLEKTQTNGIYEERYLRGPGLSGTDNIHVNLRAYSNLAIGAHNWELSGATGFDTLNSFTNQPGASPTDTTGIFTKGIAPTMVCANETINYWFVASGRRFIVVGNVGSYVFHCYCGFIVPYNTPTNYPYPLFIGGNSPVKFATKINKIGMGEFTRTHLGSFYSPPTPTSTVWDYAITSNLYTPENEWRRVLTERYAFNNNTIAYQQISCWPWTVLNSGTYFANGTDISVTTKGVSYPSPTGEYLLFPGMIHWHPNVFAGIKNESDSSITAGLGFRRIHGEFDGVYFVAAEGLEPLDTFTINTITYLVIPSSGGKQADKMAAIKLE